MEETLKVLQLKLELLEARVNCLENKKTETTTKKEKQKRNCNVCNTAMSQFPKLNCEHLIRKKCLTVEDEFGKKAMTQCPICKVDLPENLISNINSSFERTKIAREKKKEKKSKKPAEELVLPKVPNSELVSSTETVPEPPNEHKVYPSPMYSSSIDREQDDMSDDDSIAKLAEELDLDV